MSNQHFDVMIVGAGLSGIGTAHHLQEKCPNKSYAILEGRSAIGGTWDLFRYPGIRSDSDMHSLCYKFRPWHGQKLLADGPSIREYVEDTAAQAGIDKKIRYNQSVKRASWSSENAIWTVESENTQTGETQTFTCSFLQMCAGYYSYREGHKPHFPGQERFQGEMIHPQKWPENYGAKGKRVVVIGSGATAVTLVPALAETAAHVVMLQRSPTYIVSVPNKDVIAHFLRWILPASWAHALTRRKAIALEQYVYKLAREKPEKFKQQIMKLLRKHLPEDFDIEKHFMPAYNPWDQRVCLVPDADLFETMNRGKVSVITDHIETITETGIRLKSGEHIDADVIVTATGLKVVMLGEVAFDVDGAPVDFSKRWIYKGLMYSDVPNLAGTFGYINASWTLRADLQAEFVCRLLNHLDKVGQRQAAPRLRDGDAGMEALPMIQDFSSGYMQRAMPIFPKQGDRAPWLNKQNYKFEKTLLQDEPIDDGAMTFTHPVNSVSDGHPLLHRGDEPRADESISPPIGHNRAGEMSKVS